MKKAVALLLIISMMLLSGCMPGDYSKDLLKQTKKEYLAKGKAWFKENMPKARIQVMDYHYSGSSLYDVVKGSYKQNGKLVTYWLRPDNGDFYTSESYDELFSKVKELFCSSTGIGGDRLDNIFLLWEIPYCSIPGDLEESDKFMLTAAEKLTPYGLSGDALDAAAVSALKNQFHPTLLTFSITYPSIADVDLAVFSGLLGIDRITVKGVEEEGFVFEIENEVNTSGSRTCQTLRLIKRKEMSTSKEILDETTLCMG